MRVTGNTHFGRCREFIFLQEVFFYPHFTVRFFFGGYISIYKVCMCCVTGLFVRVLCVVFAGVLCVVFAVVYQVCTTNRLVK